MCDGRRWCGKKADFIAAAAPDPEWAGFAFETDRLREPVAGVYILGRLDGERVYAVYVGEADDIAQALAGHIEKADARTTAGADRFYWMREDDARARADITRTIVARYHPPGNIVPPPQANFDPPGAKWNSEDHFRTATPRRYQ
jgi:hypothetical protein